MVDEFQDTNGLQLRLIEQLRGPDTRLFLVGDEFQSIYGFRHADVEVYRREHRRFAGGRGVERRRAAADRELQGGARAGRRDERDRLGSARRLRAAYGLGRPSRAGRRAAGRAALDRGQEEGVGGRGDRAAEAARRSQLGIQGRRGPTAGGAAAGAGRRGRGSFRDRRPAARLHPRRHGGAGTGRGRP